MSELEKEKVTEEKPVRKAQKQAKKKKAKYPQLQNEATLRRLYIDERKSLNQIRDHFGIKADNSLMVRAALKRFNIPIRTQKQGLKLARQQQKKSKNSKEKNSQ